MHTSTLSSQFLISILLTTSLAFPLTTSSPTTIPTCYHPNGTLETDSSYHSCSQTPGTIGMCCAASDVCLENGLCQSTLETQDREGEKTTQYAYRRGYCTSRDWEGGGCLGVCVDGKDSSTSSIMAPCNNTSNSTTWCCGNTTDCCGTPDAITIAPVLGEHTNIPTSTSYTSSYSSSTSIMTLTSEPISSASTSTSTTIPSTTTSKPSTSTTQTNSPSQASPPEKLPGLSNGTKAGISVGVSVAVLLIFVAATILVRRLRRPKVVVEREFVSSVALTPTPTPMPMSRLRDSGREVLYGRGGGSGKGAHIREEGISVEG